MKAVVLAAGLGARLGELTENMPKPLVSVGGRPVLERNLDWLAASGIEEVWINLHHLPEMIPAAIGDGSRFGLRIRYLHEPELLGTAGTCAHLAPELGDAPFLVVYGDNVLDFELDGLRRAHAANAAIATLALYSPAAHEHTGLFGGRVEMDRAGRVLRFLEGVDDPALPWVNAGCYVVEPALLEHVRRDRAADFARAVFPHVLRNGGILAGHAIAGRCLAIDTPAALAAARRCYEPRVARPALR